MLEQLLAGAPVDPKAITAKYAAMAAELGLAFAGSDRVYNSLPAHELGHWSHSMQRTGAWHKAVYEAYYAHGRNIAKPEVLGDVAASVGLPRKTALEVLKAGTYRPAVNQDRDLARSHDIIAAPTYIIGRERLVGAQPYEKLQQFIESNGAERQAGRIEKNVWQP